MKIKSGFEVTQSEYGLYIARAVGERAEEFPNAIQMGLSGAYLWDQLSKGDPDRAALIYGLESLYEFSAGTDQVAADVDMFLGFLRENGLLEE